MMWKYGMDHVQCSFWYKILFFNQAFEFPLNTKEVRRLWWKAAVTLDVIDELGIFISISIATLVFTRNHTNEYSDHKNVQDRAEVIIYIIAPAAVVTSNTTSFNEDSDRFLSHDQQQEIKIWDLIKRPGICSIWLLLFFYFIKGWINHMMTI